MDLKATLDIIIRDLEETREIIDDLKAYPGVPLLQIELAKSKCRSAGEMIALLKDLTPDVNRFPKAGTMERENLKGPEPEIKKPETVKTPEQHKTEEPVAETPIESAKTAVIATETAIIADKFSDTPESFHEKLGGHKHEEDLTDNILRTKPFTSLSETIGISDKFMLIRELFNGSLEAYNTAIEKLESASGMSDAKNIIAGFSSLPAENETMVLLMDILKHKFPSDE